MKFKGMLEPLGWLNSLYDIAHKGIFTIGKLNAVESVKLTNIDKVLTYMAYAEIRSNFEFKVNEDRNNRQKAKDKRKK
tara:strand:- start:480 stop:713 length:234 start_codon:yes stop_codon:yes gene_type:complete